MRHLISKCLVCHCLQGTTGEQKMVNLPKERITSARPFRYCVVYLFGPFLIKQGMKEVKRHRVLFTCLASRGVHIKTAHLLEINSFMNTVRKFIARWWPVCKIRSDHRTNIVGPQTELKKALEEMDHDDIPRCPSKDFTEWVIKWKNNLQMRLIWVAFGNIDDEIKDHDAVPEHLPEGHCLSLSNSE